MKVRKRDLSTRAHCTVKKASVSHGILLSIKQFYGIKGQ